MGTSYHLDALRARLMSAKERLALERLNILQLTPNRKYDNRAAYGFVYLQAERICVNSIKQRMQEVAWLPTKINTSTEINSETRHRMTRWIKLGDNISPGEEIFGNAFVHAITRSAMQSGITSNNTSKLTDRIAGLFRDLTCLVAAIHCTNICNDLNIDEIELTAPHDLTRIALDLTLTTEALLALAEEEGEDDDETDDEYPQTNADNQNRQPYPSYLRLVPDSPPTSGAPETRN